MTIPVHLAATAAEIRTRKEQLVAATRCQPDEDLNPHLTVIRGGTVLAVVAAPALDVTLGLSAIGAAAVGYAADELVLSADAHLSHSGTNPRTGRPWAPGEMQRLCDTEGACDLGLLTNAMVSTWANRAGQLAMWTDPYHIDKTARTVTWTPSRAEQLAIEQPPFTLAGRIPDRLRDAMGAPTAVQQADGMSQPFADQVTTLLLLQRGFAVLAAESLLGATA
ncbi:MAG TPA: hypothetical protein VFQ85_07380 [Mycobacteriales bacterium]|jgi:hypothetical protein|nr:hypothetical protein [Mycobacteriales bacterium]